MNRDVDIAELCAIWAPQDLLRTREVLSKHGLDPVSIYPIGQRAYGECLRQAIPSLLDPPYWRLLDAASISSIAQRTWARLDAWQRRLEPLRKALRGRLDVPSLADLDRLQSWLWLRNLTAFEVLWLRLADAMPSLRRLYVPVRSSASRVQPWYGLGDLPILAWEHLRRHGKPSWAMETIALPENEHHVEEPHSDLVWRSTTAAGTSGPWVVVMALGLPELPLHLTRLLHRSDTTRVLLVIDDCLSGAPSELYAIASRHAGRVIVLPLFGDEWRSRLHKIRDTLEVEIGGGTRHGFDEDPVVDTLRGFLVYEQWPRHLLVGEILAEVFGSVDVRQVITSDHASPEAILLTARAAVADIPVEVIAHSGWPLPAPYRLVPPGPHTYRAWTLEAARAWMGDLSVHRRRRVLAIAAPTPRLRLDLLRPRGLGKLFLRALKRTFRRGPLTIGVVLTTGEVGIVPDVDWAAFHRALEALLDVPSSLVRRVEFRFRLRLWQDDPRALHAALGRRLRSVRCVVVPEDTSTRDFLSSCDLAIELGARSSTAFESFSTCTTYVRVESGALNATRFWVTDNVVPLLSVEGLWEKGLGRLVRRRSARVLLALRQHWFLARQTVLRARVNAWQEHARGGSWGKPSSREGWQTSSRRVDEKRHAHDDEREGGRRG